MAKKLQSLLDINAIMKQRIEKQFAELVKQGEVIKHEIVAVEIAILTQKSKTITQAPNDPLCLNLFAEWEAAQRRKIKRLQKEENALKEKQAPLRKELASLFVKEKMLTSKLDIGKKEQALKVQKHRAEQTQSLWLQNNYN